MRQGDPGAASGAVLAPMSGARGGRSVPDRPLRIVYVWDADYPWDVRTEKICQTLAQAGHDVHIVARNKQRRPLRERLPEGTVHRMRPWRWAGHRLDAALGFPAFFNPRWLSLLGRTLATLRPDVLIVRDLPLCPTAIWSGRRHGVPVVFDMAENYPDMLRLLFEGGAPRPADYLLRNPTAAGVVERYCLPRVDRTLVVVEESAARVRAMGVPPDRIDIVSNTPPLSRAAESPKEHGDSDPVELVYLGILELSRGIGELLQAVALLRDRGVRVRATIVGTGRDRDLLTAQAASLRLTSAEADFRGYVSREEALAAVAGADIGALPLRPSKHHDTTIANKLFDYMAVGLPVVVSDTAAAGRVVRETGAGEVFRAGDADDLAAAITRLLDPSVRRARGAAGRRAILERYHWERETDVLLRAVHAAAAVRTSRPEHAS